MFIAFRELRFARGRFTLISLVVALMMLLVGFLAGLAGGLTSQNISAVLQIPGDRYVLHQPEEDSPSYSTSSLSEDTVQTWEQAEGVESVIPVGIARSQATSQQVTDPSAVVLYGLAADDSLTGTDALHALVPDADDEVGLSAGAAEELGVSVGDQVTITGLEFTVASIGEDLWHSHSPVVVMQESVWQDASQRVGGTGEPTVLGVSGTADWDQVASTTQSVADPPLASLSALDAFQSEVGSLGLMVVMLFAISALVVGAFFTVWTMQRSSDLAVLKALGASTGSLIKDSLGQALIVLLAGIGLGLLAVLGLGALASQALPFVMTPVTTVVPAVVLVLVGLAGAAFALRSVVSADPLTALGSTR